MSGDSPVLTDEEVAEIVRRVSAASKATSKADLCRKAQRAVTWATEIRVGAEILGMVLDGALDVVVGRGRQIGFIKPRARRAKR